MKIPKWVLPDLLNYINKSKREDTDTIIAKTLLSKRNELFDLSLDQLSSLCYVSQPSITRFIQKMGYKSYNEFRNAMYISCYEMENLNPRLDNGSITQARDTIYNSIREALECIKEIDLESLQNIIYKLQEFKTIYIFGSELSTSISFKLQVGLISMGKDVYCISDANYQNQLYSTMDKDCLLICISMEGRWFKYIDIEAFNKCSAYKMLWTVLEKHDSQDIFDTVYRFGKIMDKDIAYNELMYFILLVYNLVLEK